MTALATLLIGVGVADLIAGFDGRVLQLRRAILSWAVGVAIAASILLASEVSLGPGAVLLVIVGASMAGWLALRFVGNNPLGASRAGWALALLALAMLLAMVVGATQDLQPGPRLGSLLGNVPLAALRSISSENVLLVVSAVLVLAATANGVVRLVFAVAGTPVTSAEETLRGGRLIGPLERWLILGLGLAGQPTAAALVISAKALLRFPELTAQRDRTEPLITDDAAREGEGHDPLPRIDVVTEYLLVGSLVSWSIALLALALVATQLP